MHFFLSDVLEQMHVADGYFVVGFLMIVKQATVIVLILIILEKLLNAVVKYCVVVYCFNFINSNFV